MSKTARIKRLLNTILKETETGVKINSKTAMNMDIGKLSQLAQKTNVIISDSEELGASIQQENAIYKLQEWAILADVMLSSPKKQDKGLLILTLQTDQGKNIACLIYPDGTIKISGKVIQSFQDFEKIIEFHNAF
jgi:hypothetical protein